MSFGAILVGAVVCLAIQLLFGLLGSGIGLSLFNLEQGEVPGQAASIGAILYAAFSILVSFFSGGYIASRLAEPKLYRSGVLCGLGVWALVSVSALYLISSNTASALGGLISRAGIGIGAAKGLDATLGELKKLDVKIVSNIELKEGLIVSQLDVDKKDSSRNQQQIGGQLEKAAKNPKVKSEIKEKGEDVRQVAAGASWIAFSGLLVAGIASSLGGRTGEKSALKNRINI